MHPYHLSFDALGSFPRSFKGDFTGEMEAELGLEYEASSGGWAGAVLFPSLDFLSSLISVLFFSFLCVLPFPFFFPSGFFLGLFSLSFFFLPFGSLVSPSHTTLYLSLSLSLSLSISLSLSLWVWGNIIQRGTASFTPCFRLPGIRVGYLILTHSPLSPFPRVFPLWRYCGWTKSCTT